MAENQDAGLNIEVNAVANKKSAEQAVNELASGVQQASKKGRIEVPVDITVPIDDTKKKLTEAQKDITSELSKMMTKGFSASGKDIDTLTSKFDKFIKALDAAGKGRQGKIFREIRKQVEEIQKSYKALKAETKSTKSYTAKATNTKKPTAEKLKKGYEDYLAKQEKYSKQAQGAGKRKELKQELAEVRANKSPIKSSGDIRASGTNDHLMRLSDYSAHGSNWANDLAKTLKEEIAKSAKTLVTYIDPIYAKKTKGGRATSEQEFLSDTIKNVRTQLKNNITQLEAGSEEITLDALKEQAAVIKVLTKALGKTTEDAEKAISSAIQSLYTQSEKKRLGGTGLEAGKEKGVGPGHENTQVLIKQLYEVMEQWDSEVFADKIAKEMVLGTDKISKTTKRKSTTSNTQAEKLIGTTKTSEEYKNELNKLNGATNKVFSELREAKKATEKQTSYDKVENVAERVADSKSQQIEEVNRDINKDTAGAVKNDARTGFNTDSKAEELISTVDKTSEVSIPDDLTNILTNILTQVTAILTTLGPKNEKHYKVTKKNKSNIQSSKQDRSFEISAAYKELGEVFKPIKNALVPVLNSGKKSKEIPMGMSKAEFDKVVPKLIEKERGSQVEKSKIYASPFRQGIFKKFEDVIESITGTTKRYENILQANADDQDKMAAERIKEYGLNNGRNPNDTGDKAGMRRILELYRTNKASIEQNPELMQKIQLTKGREVDTTELTKALNKALSGRQMRNAQNGGGFLKNALGFMTGGIGYAFMPSLEKSRAQADGLNQMLGNINKALQSVLINIQTKETELAGMEKQGDIKFDDKGNVLSGTSAAKKTLADLEEEKLVLDSIEADLLANDEIIKKTGGRFGQLVKYLNFTSPVLKENNGILRNINSGYDKNGKALKFQNRMAEILNYTFQLMSRSVGQWFKNILSMLSPLNIIKNLAGQIKNLFSDFGSYDVKWQRTMNVIKINFQRVMKPAMEWIAQKVVNLIGYVDVMSQAIQKVFNKVPISLFDQAGADAEKVRRELEEAANVTAGFDELHDIGSDNSGANDLLGDIYKPQLDPKWVEQFSKLGEVLGKFFKGDLGFGDVCKQILKMLGMLLSDMGKAIWDWFKETAIGKWITEHWKGLLASLLTIFLGWQLLKIFGPTLLSTIGGAFKTLLGKVGGWVTTLLGSSGFGSGILMAFQTLFAGGKYSLIGTLGEMFTNSAAITEAGSWGSMIGFALTKGLLAVLAGTATYKAIDHFGDNLADKTSYNLGVGYAGGKDKDKKGTALDTLGAIGSGIAGGAVTGGLVGGGIPGAVIGAVIGGVAGTIQSVLRPALEEAEVAARSLNGELQSVSFNEAQVQVFQEQSDALSEQLNILRQSLDTSTQSVYKQGEELGISKARMNELVQAVQNGTFTTNMLTGSETGLADSLTDLAQKQEHVTNVSKELEEAQKRVLKAQTELAIAQDIEAGNFEMAAARIELAEAQGAYSTEEATDRRIELFKKCAEEERLNLLQDLTPDQKKRMTDLNNLTDTELAKLNTAWQESSEVTRNAILNGLDENTQSEFKRRLNQMNQEIESHKGVWQGVGDTLAEIFSFGHANTWTYNAEAKYEDEVKKGKIRIQKQAAGTNYVEADGLRYLHQGEAIIPKKYNKPYQPEGMSPEEQAYMSQMIQTMRSLDNAIQQGINVKGEFKQRGNDLVATVEKAKNRNGNQPLNNPVFAR